MKHNYLKYLAILLAISVATSGFAQSIGSSNKSRLTTGQKVSSQKNSLQKFSILGTLPVSSSTVTPKRSTAINAFYRNILFTNTSTPSAARTSGAEPAAVASSDIRTKVSEIQKVDDKMFQNANISVNNVYPNPANDFAEIEYQISGNSDAKISIYNSISNKMAEFNLDKRSQILRIPTRDFPTTVYFYQLVIDGKPVATKKLIVRH